MTGAGAATSAAGVAPAAAVGGPREPIKSIRGQAALTKRSQARVPGAVARLAQALLSGPLRPAQCCAVLRVALLSAVLRAARQSIPRAAGGQIESTLPIS